MKKNVCVQALHGVDTCWAKLCKCNKNTDRTCMLSLPLKNQGHAYGGGLVARATAPLPSSAEVLLSPNSPPLSRDVQKRSSTRVLGRDSDDRSWKRWSWGKTILIGYSSTVGGTLSSDYFTWKHWKYRREKREKIQGFMIVFVTYTIIQNNQKWNVSQVRWSVQLYVTQTHENIHKYIKK